MPNVLSCTRGDWCLMYCACLFSKAAEGVLIAGADPICNRISVDSCGSSFIVIICVVLNYSYR